MKKVYKRIAAIACAVILCAAGAFAYWKFAIKEEEPQPFDFKITLPLLNTGKYPDAELAKKSERSFSVSTSNDLATNVGMAVLGAGGNAVDAAVAVSYMLGVVEPYASGIGGSGGMLVYDTGTGRCVFYDYRACAGSASYSPDNAGVPGFVAGMAEVHKDYGTISMYDLITPAIEYAENGYPVGEALEHRINYAKTVIGEYDWFKNEEGKILKEGEIFRQPEHAKTLRAIRQDGPDAFYKGRIAEDIAAVTSLKAEDIAGFSVIKSDALEGYYEGYKVFSAGGPLSGMTLIQMLEMADELDIPDPRSDPAAFTSQLKTITGIAYSDRFRHVTDRTFYPVDEASFISRSYILDLLDMEDDSNAYEDDESMETTSFSIVDSNGLVVSCTNTLSSFWGCKKAADGFFINNSLDNFSESGVNKYEPGKRARTYTAPTIITGKNGYVLSVGTPGGSAIPGLLFNVISDVLKYGLEPQKAVEKPSLIYKSGVLSVELDEDGNTWLDTSKIKERIVYRSMGYWWGCISLAGYDGREAFGAYDFRRNATKVGIYNPGEQLPAK